MYSRVIRILDMDSLVPFMNKQDYIGLTIFHFIVH